MKNLKFENYKNKTAGLQATIVIQDKNCHTSKTNQGHYIAEFPKTSAFYLPVPNTHDLCIMMCLFDLKQKFTSKHPTPFTKTVGCFKSSFVTKIVSLNVTKYARLSFCHNRNHILPTGSDL